MTEQNQSPVVTDAAAKSIVDWLCDDVLPAYGIESEASRNDVELFASARAALEAALPSGVRVKALSFKDRGHNNGDRYCNTEVGQYAIGNIHGTIMVILRRVRDGQDDDSIIWEGDDWAEAEKAACDDHASRILDAIEPTPSPSHAETVAPYAAALRMIRDAVGELFGPASDLESEEAVLLRGPEPHHDAEAIIAGLQRVKRETERLLTLNADLEMQARGHAQEARTANATIYEIYQVLSGGKGEPGNWNGAEPARQYVHAAEARVAELEKALNWAMGCGDDFPAREDGKGAYWWRTELAERAGMAYDREVGRYIALRTNGEDSK